MEGFFGFSEELMRPCCVCLEDTDDCYDCMVCKGGHLCWTCWERLYE